MQNKYYLEKLGVHKSDATARQDVVGSFIEGLHWVLEYYYRGVASWTWFYPYHYAPMISDMVAIEDFEVAFQLGRPFLPFQQLLGVLPSASFKLLPEPYQVQFFAVFGMFWFCSVGVAGMLPCCNAAGFRHW